MYSFNVRVYGLGSWFLCQVLGFRCYERVSQLKVGVRGLGLGVGFTGLGFIVQGSGFTGVPFSYKNACPPRATI